MNINKKYIKITIISIFIIIITSIFFITNNKNNILLDSPNSTKYNELETQKRINDKLKEQYKTALLRSYIEKKETEKAKEKIEIKGLVPLESLSKDFIIDLRYATANNFTGERIYPINICVIRKETALKLINANNLLLKQGYRIKIWDAYRPFSVQKIFWDVVKGTPNEKYVADPNKNGSRHNSGAAVDVTLVDMNGKEVIMPSKFDEFSKKAWRNNANMSKEARKHLEILTKAMKQSGFNTINSEWWHYEDSNYKNYPKKLDIPLNKFVN